MLPLITTHIAHFPKLRMAYFGLLSYMAEVHAARLAGLHLPQVLQDKDTVYADYKMSEI